MIEITPQYLAAQGFSPSFPQRFWAKINKTESCWLWTAGKASMRYGNIGARGHTMIRAHIASWILHVGPVPEGMEVCHSCDNPLCVRPDHLWIGTHAQNMADCKAKGRARTRHGEEHGMSKLTQEQVEAIRQSYSSKDKNGGKLARAFGVTRHTIWKIIHHRTWSK